MLRLVLDVCVAEDQRALDCAFEITQHALAHRSAPRPAVREVKPVVAVIVNTYLFAGAASLQSPSPAATAVSRDVKAMEQYAQKALQSAGSSRSPAGGATTTQRTLAAGFCNTFANNSGSIHPRHLSGLAATLFREVGRELDPMWVIGATLDELERSSGSGNAAAGLGPFRLQLEFAQGGKRVRVPAEVSFTICKASHGSRRRRRRAQWGWQRLLHGYRQAATRAPPAAARAMPPAPRRLLSQQRPTPLRARCASAAGRTPSPSARCCCRNKGNDTCSRLHVTAFIQSP